MTAGQGKGARPPETRARHSQLSREDQLTILNGSSFMTTNAAGDVEEGQTTGFFHHDVRHLSWWQLLVNGKPTTAITSSCVDYFSARIVSLPDRDAAPSDGEITVRRDRFVANGVHEDLTIANHGREPVSLRIELVANADFADIHELGAPGQKKGASPPRRR